MVEEPRRSCCDVGGRVIERESGGKNENFLLDMQTSAFVAGAAAAADVGEAYVFAPLAQFKAPLAS